MYTLLGIYGSIDGVNTALEDLKSNRNGIIVGNPRICIFKAIFTQEDFDNPLYETRGFYWKECRHG